MTVTTTHPTLSDSPVTIHRTGFFNGVFHSFRFSGYRNKTLGMLHFQKGGRATTGVNGLTLEVIIAACIDNIQGHQETDLACKQNAGILTHLEAVMQLCADRHADRVRRGVKGQEIA